MTEGIRRIGIDRVVVMDDDRITVNIIGNVFSSYGAEILVARSADEVTKLAKDRRVRFYVLDVSMGMSKPKEGLIAARRVRNIDPHAFVGILTRTEIGQQVKERFDINHVQKKSSNPIEDAKGIVNAAINYVEAETSAVRQYVHDTPISRETRYARRRNLRPKGHSRSKQLPTQIQKLSFENRDTVNGLQRELESLTSSHSGYQLEKEDSSSSLEDLNPTQDLNYKAYIELLNDPNWRDSRLGWFVAFVEGKLVASAQTAPELFSKLNEQYPQTRAFVSQVSAEDEELDFAAHYDIEDV